MKYVFFTIIIFCSSAILAIGQKCDCYRLFPINYWDGNKWNKHDLWIFDYNSMEGIDTLTVNDNFYKYEIITIDCLGAASITEYDSVGTITGKFIFMQGIDTLKSQVQMLDLTGEIAGYSVYCYFEGILIEYCLYNSEGIIIRQWKDDLKWMKD